MSDKLPTGIVRTGSGRYGAKYTYHKQAFWVGSFDTIAEAVAARKAALPKDFVPKGPDNQPSNAKDLRGKVFGHLTVIDDTGERAGTEIVWHCRCDCGRSANVVGSKLISGNTTSCGHLQDAKKMNALNQKDLKKYGTNPNRLRDNPPKNSSTGIRGVGIRHTKYGIRYTAYIGFQGKRISASIYNTIEEAAKARKELEKKYWTETKQEFEKAKSESKKPN